jgi:hypothetical protein
MCADMKLQQDDMTNDLHAHGARELVSHNLVAGNQKYVGSARELASHGNTTTTSTSDICPMDYSGSTETRKKLNAEFKVTMNIPSSATGADLLNNKEFTSTVEKSVADALGKEVNADDVKVTEVTLSRRRQLETRELAGASKTVNVKYTITLPPGMADNDVQDIVAATSAGGAGATVFATALTTTLKKNIENSDLGGDYGNVSGVEAVGTAAAPSSSATSSAFRSSFSVGAVVAATLLSGFDMRLSALALLAFGTPVVEAAAGHKAPETDSCGYMQGLFRDMKCCGKDMDSTSTDVQFVPAQTGKFLKTATNPCEGAKPASGFDNAACSLRQVLRSLQTKPQAATEVTEGYVGTLSTNSVPINETLFSKGLCPVNVHWHLGAEHKSQGQYDDVTKSPGATAKSTAPAANSNEARYESARRGFRCSKASGETPDLNTNNTKWTKKYKWQHCIGMEVGETYEVHWPHSTAGACGTVDQYQSPFYDGVFCLHMKGKGKDLNTDPTVLPSMIGVQAQVYTIVNDEDYYYPDLMRGMIVDGEFGKKMTYYTGSTTGTSRDNTVCSSYTPITWQVDRQCHQISASSFDKMCADMKLQRDDMSSDLHAHGAREVVDTKYAADNHQNHGRALADKHLDKP